MRECWLHKTSYMSIVKWSYDKKKCIINMHKQDENEFKSCIHNKTQSEGKKHDNKTQSERRNNKKKEVFNYLI